MNQNCCEKCRRLRESFDWPDGMPTYYCTNPSCPCHSPSSQESRHCVHGHQPSECKIVRCINAQSSANWESQLRTKFLEKESPEFTSNELISFIRKIVEQAWEEGYFAKISHYETKTIPNYYKTGVEAGRTAALKEVVEITDKLIRENDDVGVDRLEKGYDMGLFDLKQSITSLLKEV